MEVLTEILLAAFFITDLCLASASRLLHCIRLAAYQGVLLGVLPLIAWKWGVTPPHAEQFFVAVLSIGIKAVLLPRLLRSAMDRAGVRRELEPLVGYPLSSAIVLAAAAASLWCCLRYHIALEGGPVLAAPVAFTTMATGLFIIMARRKAITQAIGFLVFENGITLFGIGMMLEYGLIVELGILLDVFVLVFVMGIAVFQISREFSHIDSDRLHELSDLAENKTAPAEGEVK